MNILAAEARLADFTCGPTESLFAAAEKCLDNRVGQCFLVDAQHRVLGRITLDEIRGMILDGRASLDTSLQQSFSAGEGSHVCAAAAEGARTSEVVTPILAEDGRLIDIRIDRSRQFVPIAQPDLSHHELRAVLDAVLSSWISSKGAYIEKFEQEFSSFVGMRHGVATSNGTVALHLALLALGIGPGDEVIIPDLTFAATINAVLYCGATPVVVDVDEASWTMSVAQVAQAYTSRTKAIIPVHLYGRPAEIEKIAEFARCHDLRVIEDCAEAHGAKCAGRRVGQFSDISCFSFYANKIITTGEGGMCLTNSDSLAASLKEMRSHGMTPSRSYWHERVGYNYRLTNMQAAIGLMQLRKIDQTLQRNQKLQRLYRDHLAGIPGIRFAPPLSADYEPVVWLACALVPAAARAALIEAAAQAEIELRPFFHPLSEMPPYRQFGRFCPNSAALARTGLNLPTSAAVDTRVVEKVAKIFQQTLANAQSGAAAEIGPVLP